ncbi:MAG: hypothetical protein EOP06_27695 [Proteobacteria bacterium]|nr:MAG: hypothetical protein EOP06_27695 [Pseudomonadota bacterium]
MISIEESASAQARIEENKPFRIPVMYENSKTALPKLRWDKKQFLWLDYDDPLQTDILYDIRTVTRRASSGCLLSVSLQCSQAPSVAEAIREGSGGPSALDRFIGLFGREKVPLGTLPDDLYSWRFGKLSRQMLETEIEAELARRNSTDVDDMRFTKICDIEYEDGAKMTTIVGIFHRSADQYLLEACKFETLEFIPEQPLPIRIDIPKLTLREFKRLESQLPLAPNMALELGNIPVAEARNFHNMYRYLPNFAVLES